MIATIKALLHEVLLGDGATSRRLPRLARSEDGLITWATLIAVVLFVALIAIVFNVGRIANDKLEAQNAADSVAYSSSLVQARAMNALTASNHMMGELTAMYTLHHAFVDRNREANNLVTYGLATTLTIEEPISYAAGTASMIYGGSQPPTFGLFDPGKWWDIPYGNATIYDSKCLVKWKLIEEYLKHAVGSAKIMTGIYLMAPPPFGDSGATYFDGLRMQREASIEITALKAEYRILHQVQQFTRRTMSTKEKIPGVMRAIYTYERLVVQGTALSCTLAAKRVAAENQCEGEVVGRPKLTNVGAAIGIPSANLAVVPDPTTRPRRSQLLRATYPWLRTWREPILTASFFAVPRSRATLFYEYHTDRFALQLTSQRLNFRLFVLEQMNATTARTDKGTETWRKRSQSRLADEMFAVVGVARRKTPTAQSHMNFFLPRTNPTPVTAISQAMIYNANTPTRWTPGFVDNLSLLIHRRGQPVPSWDTLNWTEGATEWIEGKPYVGWDEHVSGLIPGGMGQYLSGFLSDIRWVAGRLPREVMDAAYPPDALILPIPTIVPTPKVKLNWQSKLVPIAQDTLFVRTFMVSDSVAANRLRTQVLPVVNPVSRAVPDMLQPNVINH